MYKTQLCISYLCFEQVTVGSQLCISCTGDTFWKPVTGWKPIYWFTGYRFNKPTNNPGWSALEQCTLPLSTTKRGSKTFSGRQWSYRWTRTLWRSTSSTISSVYAANLTGPRTEPWGTLGLPPCNRIMSTVLMSTGRSGTGHISGVWRHWGRGCSGWHPNESLNTCCRWVYKNTRHRTLLWKATKVAGHAGRVRVVNLGGYSLYIEEDDN